MARGRRKPRYYWDGIQWPQTAIDTTASFALTSQTSQEFMPGTIERIRGWISFRGVHATTTGLINAKLMYLEVNDATAITGDAAAIDTHEEDIATRQLWTFASFIGALDEDNLITLPVDIKAKLRLDSAGKKGLFLLMQTTVTATVVTMGYLRALVRMG